MLSCKLVRRQECFHGVFSTLTLDSSFINQRFLTVEFSVFTRFHFVSVVLVLVCGVFIGVLEQEDDRFFVGTRKFHHSLSSRKSTLMLYASEAFVFWDCCWMWCIMYFVNGVAV